MSQRRKFPGIYKITHTPTGLFYIGKSTDVTSRWKSHLNNFFSGKHTKAMQGLWDTSHYSDWKFEIVKICKVKELEQMEKKYISEADGASLLNVRDKPKKISKTDATSIGTQIFMSMSDADKEKLSAMTTQAMLGANGIQVTTQIGWGAEEEM